MLFGSHIIRYYRNNNEKNVIKKFLEHKNLPLIYYYSEENFIFFITLIANNAMIFQTEDSNSYKYAYIPITRSEPISKNLTNYYSKEDSFDSAAVSFFDSLKIFNINLTNLNRYKPNITFQNSLYNILTIYNTRKNINILTSNFFINGNKTDFLNELQTEYNNNNLPEYELNTIISNEPFIESNISIIPDIAIEDLKIRDIIGSYIINTEYIDSSASQDQTIYNINYYLDICKSTGYYNKSIYYEYSNIYFNKYRIYENETLLKYALDSTQDSDIKNLLVKTFIINDSIVSDDISINKPNVYFNPIENNITSNNNAINNIFNHINKIVEVFYEQNRKNKTTVSLNRTIDSSYLTMIGMKYIYENIPGLNNISSIIKKSDSISSFNTITIKGSDVTNIPYIDVTDLNITIIPNVHLEDNDLNTVYKLNFIFLNNTDEIYLPASLDNYDIIKIINTFNSDSIIINRSLADNKFYLTSLLNLTIKHYDSTNVYPDFSNSYGNILYYLQAVNPDIFKSPISQYYVYFKIRLNVKINSKILENIDPIYGTFKIYGASINKNLNLNKSIDNINKISYSGRDQLNNSTIMNTLKNQDNLYPFPLPIIIILNKITYIPALSINSINLINQYFDYTTFEMNLFNGGVDLLETAETILNILETHSPDNTEDINVIKNYLNISYEYIKSGINSNNIAFIFLLYHVESQEIFPFVIQNGKTRTFIDKASLYLYQTDNNYSIPNSGLSEVKVNQAEKSLFIDSSNEDSLYIEIEPVGTFTYKSTFSSMPIVIPLNRIEILNLNNIFSNIYRLELTVYKVLDSTTKTTSIHTIDITNIESIYDSNKNRHIIYLNDSTDIFVDYVKIKLYAEVPKYNFEFHDIIGIDIFSNFSELNKSTNYRIKVKYLVSESNTYTLSNIIPLFNNDTFMTNNYYINYLAFSLFNISDTNLQSYLPETCIFIFPVNINIYTDSTFMIPSETDLLYDLTEFDPLLDLNNVYLLNLVSNNLNYNKVNNILYLNPLYNYQGKYFRGYIKVSSSSNNLIMNIINEYDDTSIDGYKIFCDGKVSNINDSIEDFNDYPKFYRLILDSTVGEFTVKTLVPVIFNLKYKFYNTKEDYLNDVSYTIEEYDYIKIFNILSLSDYITSENSYTPMLLEIIKKEDVYPEFGEPKNYIFNLQIKIKTKDSTIANISNVFFDIIKMTSDIEVGIYSYDNLTDYNIGDNIITKINDPYFKWETESDNIIKYFNKYLLLKTSVFPNATEIILNGIIRIRPKFYGINFAGFTLNSYNSNLKIQQLIPYLYITEYGNVLSIYKNNGIVHVDDIITNEFRNILPEQARDLDFYEIISKFRWPNSSYASIQLLNCTNRKKDIKIDKITNTSGKIYKGQNSISLSIGPYEFKNVKISEPIDVNDYTSSDSGIIKFDVSNLTNNYIIDNITVPIPSLDKYIYQLMSFIDNLNVNRNSDDIKIFQNTTDKERDFKNNIMINVIDNSLIDQYAYFDLSNIEIFRNKIDYVLISTFGEEDQKRCTNYINNFSNVVNSGFISIPIELGGLLNNIIIDYNLNNGIKTHFILKELKEYIINSLIKEHNIDYTSADETSNYIIQNDFMNIYIPGNTVGSTCYIKMLFNRTNIFEYKFYLYTNILLNITNPVNKYLVNFIKEKNNLKYNIDISLIDEINLSCNITIFDPATIIKDLFIGFNIKSSNIIYNYLLNKIPNIGQKDLENIIIENNGVITNKIISIHNKYKYSKYPKYPIINDIRCFVNNKNIKFRSSLSSVTDPEEILKVYLEYKDVYDRNNYPCEYIVDFDYVNVDNISKEDILFNPIINNIPYRNNDNLILLDVYLNDVILLSDNEKYYGKNLIKQNNTITIKSLYPKFDNIKLNINNYLFGPYYNEILPTFISGREIAKSKSKFYIRIPKEYNTLENFEYSLFSKNPKKQVIIKNINPNKDVICIADIVLEKYVENIMSLDRLEIYTNIPGDVNCYVSTIDNELFKMDTNNYIKINKEFSRFFTGIETIGKLYITGVLNQTGEYQVFINTKYTILETTYNTTIEFIVRVYKTEALDTEYIILKHERLDSPIDINPSSYKKEKEALELLNKFKAYAFSHVRGLCGGGGFEYRDTFWDID